MLIMACDKNKNFLSYRDLNITIMFILNYTFKNLYRD